MQRSTERPISDGAKDSTYLFPLVIMGFRFGKSFSPIKGVRINLSKSGLGISTGIKGARIGIGTRGAYTSLGIPGTGISSRNYLGKGKTKKQNIISQEKPKGNMWLGSFGLLSIVLMFINLSLGLIFFFLLLIIQIFLNEKAKQKASRKSVKEVAVMEVNASNTLP